LTGSLAERLRRIDEREPLVRALLPEPGRRERLRRAAPDASLVAVKDVFHAAGFQTRAGSLLPPEVLTGPEASCVTRLKEAGCVVLGKTVTAEFAFFEPGPTRNPLDPDRTPGGSSSGSAAAVAAGYCPVALGTQTIGSIVRPAAYCGVFGFKPTYGRIPVDGVIPCAPSFDTVGIIAEDLDALQRAAAVLCDGWRERAGASPILGIPEGPYLDQTEPAARQAFEGIVARLGGRGMPLLDDIEEIAAAHLRLMAAEMARVHERWFNRFADLYRPRTAAFIRAGMEVPDEDLEPLRLKRDELCERMSSTRVDVWLSPAATGPAPLSLASTGDPAMNLPWTNAGMPTITVPAGTADGMPVGLQLSSAPGTDELLVAWAAGIQSAIA